MSGWVLVDELRHLACPALQPICLPPGTPLGSHWHVPAPLGATVFGEEYGNFIVSVRKGG